LVASKRQVEACLRAEARLGDQLLVHVGFALSVVQRMSKPA